MAIQYWLVPKESIGTFLQNYSMQARMLVCCQCTVLQKFEMGFAVQINRAIGCLIVEHCSPEVLTSVFAAYFGWCMCIVFPHLQST